MTSEIIEEFHKKNFIIWTAILGGMIAIVIVTFVLDGARTFTPIKETVQVKNILFTVAIVLTIGILFLKRLIFVPQKIVEKIKETPAEDREKKLFSQLRINYIIIWAMGETVLFLGFVEYVFILNFDSFLIYAVVGLYAVIINIPRKIFIEKSLELLSE